MELSSRCTAEGPTVENNTHTHTQSVSVCTAIPCVDWIHCGVCTFRLAFLYVCHDIHSHSHTHTHTHTHNHLLTCMHTLTHTQVSNTHIHAYITHILTYRHSPHTRVCVYTHIYTHIHKHTLTHTYSAFRQFEDLFTFSHFVMWHPYAKII